MELSSSIYFINIASLKVSLISIQAWWYIAWNSKLNNSEQKYNIDKGKHIADISFGLCPDTISLDFARACFDIWEVPVFQSQSNHSWSCSLQMNLLFFYKTIALWWNKMCLVGFVESKHSSVLFKNYN